ncbi:hypothetical protein CPB83DRAFT_899019 [Crepidotus variabilis]|uniref:Uncharacterized protein n=1 Tax=Crepidotus variabilis TaxID=179855 RepID=A0A9P6JJN9_9AGAR|nr:hypothetical protein CPB83DRAFT_899019 [Crepidotus variabilis]
MAATFWKVEFLMVSVRIRIVFFKRDKDPLWADEIFLFDDLEALGCDYDAIQCGQDTYRAFGVACYRRWTDFLACCRLSGSSKWLALVQPSIPTVKIACAERCVGYDLRYDHPRTLQFTATFTSCTFRECRPVSRSAVDPEMAPFEYGGVTYQSHGSFVKWFFQDLRDDEFDVDEGHILMLESSLDKLAKKDRSWETKG